MEGCRGKWEEICTTESTEGTGKEDEFAKLEI
jgi:hypothetical protein